jgi:hypothetical protein
MMPDTVVSTAVYITGFGFGVGFGSGVGFGFGFGFGILNHVAARIKDPTCKQVKLHSICMPGAQKKHFRYDYRKNPRNSPARVRRQQSPEERPKLLVVTDVEKTIKTSKIYYHT